MSRLCPLFSGSNGNATLISSHNTKILIDAGVSFKRLKAALEEVGCDIKELSAVFVTHEHNDHVCGLKTLLKNTSATLCASQSTLNALNDMNIIPEKTTLFDMEGKAFTYDNISVSRFATSHDCCGSSGYVFTAPDGARGAVCTDLGIMTNEVRSALTGCDTILIEANHDITMLNKGPYPPSLKMRILSDKGHLSNNACAIELPFLLQNGTKQIVLGHLSQKNNTPNLAANAANATLMDIGAKENCDYMLYVAAPQSNREISF